MTEEDQAAGTQPLGYLLAEGVYALYHGLQRTVTGLLNELGLTEALADALWQLNPADGPLPRRALADRLHCDPSNVTLLVDQLEERGLARRAVDPGDRRIKAIALTPAGIVIRDRLIAATAHSPAFAALSDDERRHLADLLTRCQRQPHPPLHSG